MSQAPTDQQLGEQTPPRGLDVLHVITSTQRRGAETFAVDLDAALSELGMASAVVALTAGGPVSDDAMHGVPHPPRDDLRAIEYSDTFEGPWHRRTPSEQ